MGTRSKSASALSSIIMYSGLHLWLAADNASTGQNSHGTGGEPCTLQDDFINQCPKFGTNRIVALMTSNDRLI